MWEFTKHSFNVKYRATTLLFPVLRSFQKCLPHAVCKLLVAARGSKSQADYTKRRLFKALFICTKSFFEWWILFSVLIFVSGNNQDPSLFFSYSAIDAHKAQCREIKSAARRLYFLLFFIFYSFHLAAVFRSMNQFHNTTFIFFRFQPSS